MCIRDSNIWYGDNLDELLAVHILDKNDVFDTTVEMTDDKELHAKYPSPNSLPNKIVDEILIRIDDVFNSTAIGTAIANATLSTWNTWLRKQQELEHNEEQLWDTEVKNNDNT